MLSNPTNTAEGEYEGGQFRIVLRQQPQRARMCGFSDIKDRRLVDPPPVIQLILQDRKGNQVLPKPEETSHWICHASLFSANREEERNVVVKPSRRSGSGALHETALTPASAESDKAKGSQARMLSSPSSSIAPAKVERKSFRPWCSDESSVAALPLVLPNGSVPPSLRSGPPSANTKSGTQSLPEPLVQSASALARSRPLPDPSRCIQTLVGATVASCETLRDVDGREGMFFVYNDLSVRPQGSYRLKFLVVHLNFEATMAEVKAAVITDVFEVSPPKSFPGMTESTSLSKCFARQGVPIHIRKDWSQTGPDETHTSR
ncbi:velvet factor [Powellomyces hirtus]|nr:velvet factor [Powellomyces hirtus]